VVVGGGGGGGGGGRRTNSDKKTDISARMRRTKKRGDSERSECGKDVLHRGGSSEISASSSLKPKVESAGEGSSQEVCTRS